MIRKWLLTCNQLAVLHHVWLPGSGVANFDSRRGQRFVVIGLNIAIQLWQLDLLLSKSC